MAGEDQKNNDLHAGHRQRLYGRVQNEGLSSFSDHQVLELLLFNTIARGDTNPIAHKLMNHFGSLPAVFEADIHELLKIKGVGEKSARFISMLAPLTRRYLHSVENLKKTRLNSLDLVIEYLKPLLITRKSEVFYVLSLDSKCGVIHPTLLTEGVVNETAVYPRQIVEVAIRHNASAVIIAHNHPSGSAKPSEQDVELTKRLSFLMQSISIPILDHIIIARGSNFSFAQETNLLK